MRRRDNKSSLPKGKQVYHIGSRPITGEGRRWPSDAVDEQCVAAVASVFNDDAGVATMRAIIERAGVGAFDEGSLWQVVSPRRTRAEEWQVGEALAECYLTLHHSCEFPWSAERDKKVPGASLPGPDLVGLCVDGKVVRFAFGEIKTSSQKQYPPGVMHGANGLPSQLMRIRDRKTIRDQLVQYLVPRVQGSDALWGKFKKALKRYHRASDDVHLFGVLVRDAVPKKKDLQGAVTKLQQDRSSKTSIELLAIYVPPGAITSLAKKIVGTGQGDPS